MVSIVYTKIYAYTYYKYTLYYTILYLKALHRILYVHILYYAIRLHTILYTHTHMILYLYILYNKYIQFIRTILYYTVLIQVYTTIHYAHISNLVLYFVREMLRN